MLAIDPRAARFTWTVALVVLLFSLVYLVRTTLFIFILAVLFAYLLSPLVNLLDRFLPRSWTRTWALGLAYVIFVGLVVLAGIQIGSRVVDQANRLSRDFPRMIAGWEQPSPSASPTVNSIKAEVVDKIRTEVAKGSNGLVAALPQAGMKLLAVASNLIYVVIIPILAFFFLKDGHLIRRQALEIVEPGPRRELLDDVMADVDVLLAHYMRALVMLALATFTADSIFFSIVGVPYGILLAALAGLLEIIPMLGPLTAGITIVLVTAVSGAHVLAVVIFLVAYRVFQDYILSPHLMKQGVELHPLVVLFGVFAGAEVAGIAGTFLSVPLLALVRILYVRIRKARLAAQLTPTEVVRT